MTVIADKWSSEIFRSVRIMKATIQRVTSLFGVPRASVFVPRISTPFILHSYISNGRMVLFPKNSTMAAYPNLIFGQATRKRSS